MAFYARGRVSTSTTSMRLPQRKVSFQGLISVISARRYFAVQRFENIAHCIRRMDEPILSRIMHILFLQRSHRIPPHQEDLEQLASVVKLRTELASLCHRLSNNRLSSIRYTSLRRMLLVTKSEHQKTTDLFSLDTTLVQSVIKPHRLPEETSSSFLRDENPGKYIFAPAFAWRSPPFEGSWLLFFGSAKYGGKICRGSCSDAALSKTPFCD